MIETDECLIVPAAIGTEQPLVIELEKILLAERRQEEVAIVTKEKAPELLYFFNKEWLKLHALVTRLTSEKTKAEKELEKRKSVILLDEVTEILKNKGVSSTAETRKAVIELDEEYNKKEDILNQISAALELVKGKLKGFENSFSAVKRLISDRDSLNQSRHPDLSGTTYTPPSKPPRPGFGVARV